MSHHIRLSLETTQATAPLIALLRRHTCKPISDLRREITNRQPFLDERPHHNQYSKFIERVTKLFDDLEAEGVCYLVEVDGSPETPQYLRNVFQHWREVEQRTQRMIDLESGEPCIETLEWLKRDGPAGVFLRTIDQIVSGEGYVCDDATKEWARRELDAAGPGVAPDSSGI